LGKTAIFAKNFLDLALLERLIAVKFLFFSTEYTLIILLEIYISVKYNTSLI